MKAFFRQNSIPVFFVLFLSLLLTIASYEPAYPGAETASFSGKVVSIKLGSWIPFVNRTAELVIEDFNGRYHTVHAGVKTSYFPHRTPQLRDRVTINCIKDEGRWAATTVTYN